MVEEREDANVIVNPCNEMLLRIAQADAHAYAVEYVNYETHSGAIARDACLAFDRFVKNPTRNEHVPGEYTDDTQMSIAVSECIVKYGIPSQLQLAESFVRCFKRDSRQIYARGFQWVLENVADGLTLMSNLCSNSDKNGAAMRSVPLGVIGDCEEMLHLASEQAAITHNTPGGITSSMLVALMSRFSLQTASPLRDLRSYLMSFAEKCPLDDIERFIVHPFDARVAGNELGMKTVAAALTAVVEETTMVGALRRVIERGGDTDSVAAITWGVMAPRFTHEPIPDFFERYVGGTSLYGRDFLVSLGGQLMNHTENHV
jgi:ADP-ribosyl-[dinitrogen reductase] hydrolase